MKKLSLVVITFNEEANIERCLRSVPMADDIIVLDSQSTDNTTSIARRCGARTFIEEWRGYFLQKKRATALAQFDWVLSLDADEALSEDLQKAITEWKEKDEDEDPEVDAYEFSRLTYHMGRWIHRGGWYPDRQTRLFHRKRCDWQGGHVHERVGAEKLERWDKDLLHWSFKDLAHQIDTNNRYSTLGAQDLMEKNKSFSVFKLIFKPISKFVETYIIKRGFMDGLPGFIISVGAAYSVFLKFSKLWELKKLKK